MRNGEKTHRLQVVFALVLVMSTGVELSSIPTAEAPGQVGASGQAYPTTSWAVGLVVPEGASLQGGGKVAWEGVNNLTAAVTLPNITLPDEIVYAVVSVMTSDGSVLQTAAGIWPNDSEWFVYAWLIPSSSSVPLAYQWVLNGSEPAMTPGANVSISIYQVSGSWGLRVTDEESGAELTQQFPSGVGQSLMVGDQEVFALESYSRLGATFRDMGNLTLTGMFLDGLKVTGGVYAYSDWDPTHNPLFSVGSAGVSPPSFVSLGQARDGSFVWGYETQWSSPNDTLAAVETLLILAFVVLGVVGVVLWKTRKAKTP